MEPTNNNNVKPEKVEQNIDSATEMTETEAINSNGPRPRGYDPYYQPPAGARRRRRRNLFCLVLAMAIPFLMLIASVSFISARHYSMSITEIAWEHDEALLLVATREAFVEAHYAARDEALVEAHRVAREAGELSASIVRGILDELPHLSVIYNIGAASGELRIAAEDVRKLNVAMSHGSLVIDTHDGDEILVISRNAINSYFDREQGVLNITENSHAAIRISVPYSTLEAIFDEVNIAGRHALISVNGDPVKDDNAFFTEDLIITNRHGLISLSDIAVSGRLNITNRHGNINLHNIIADADRLSVYNRHGGINVS